MFYEASQIDTLIICKICDQKLDDPRLLPCGKSVCYKCIQTMTVNDSTKLLVKCPHCAKTHEVPKDGFAPNLEIGEIINLKSNQIIKSEIFDELKHVSDLIQEKAEKIKDDLLSGKTQINDRCDKIRHEIKLAIDEAHLFLDKTYEKFTEKIDNYQKECHQNYEKICQNKEKFENFLYEANTFKSKIDTTLKQLQINDMVIKSGLREANKLLKDLGEVEDKIKLKFFNKVSLNFHKSVKTLKTSMIGRLKNEHIQMSYFKNSEKINELDLTQQMNHSKPYPYTMVYPFGTHRGLASFLIVRNFHDKTILFSSIDHKGNILVEHTLSLHNRLVFIRVTPLINNNFFCVCTIEEQPLIQNRFVRIQSFDKDLKLISKKYLDLSVRFISANNEYLFIGHVNSNGYISLGMYSSNFEALKVYGQGNENLPFYLPSSILRLLIGKKCFIINEQLKDNKRQCKITVLRQKNGTVKSTFQVKSFDSWELYLEEFILLFNYNCKKIACYNLNGVLMLDGMKFKIDLRKFKFTLNEKIYFLDNDKEKLKLLSF